MAAMRQVAEVITTETGNTLPWPTVDDTANEGVLIGENVQNTEQDFTFGTKQLEAYMYSSTIVRVSFQILQDSAFDLDTWLAKGLGQRIGRIQARHFTVGAGTTEPDGIATSATAGVTGVTGQTTTVGYDDLMSLSESIDPAYIEGGNCNWMMSQDARKMVRKIRTTRTGRCGSRRWRRVHRTRCWVTASSSTTMCRCLRLTRSRSCSVTSVRRM